MPEKPLADQRQRIDKWLFFTRIIKSRALAQDLVAAGLVRLNGAVVPQPSKLVSVGDRLDIQLGHGDLAVVVVSMPERRGPSLEAHTHYRELDLPRVPLTPFERAQRRT
jgi:ribosome-associated heat shock protein Hsp15